MTDIDLDKQLRICIEVYMSKIRSIDKLLDILDKTMQVVQEELLGTNEN